MDGLDILPALLLASATILSLLIIRRNRLRMASKAVRTISVIVLSACFTTLALLRQGNDPTDPKVLLSALVFFCSALWIQHELFPYASLTLADPCGPGAKKGSKKRFRQHTRASYGPDSEFGFIIRSRRSSTDPAVDESPTEKAQALKPRAGHEQHPPQVFNVEAAPKKGGALRKPRGGKVKFPAGYAPTDTSLFSLDDCAPPKCSVCSGDATTAAGCCPQYGDRPGTSDGATDGHKGITGFFRKAKQALGLEANEDDEGQTGLKNTGKAVETRIDECLRGCRQNYLECEREAIGESLKEGQFDLLSTDTGMQSPEIEGNACTNIFPCKYDESKDQPREQEALPEGQTGLNNTGKAVGEASRMQSPEIEDNACMNTAKAEERVLPDEIRASSFRLPSDTGLKQKINQGPLKRFKTLLKRAVATIVAAASLSFSNTTDIKADLLTCPLDTCGEQFPSERAIEHFRKVHQHKAIAGTQGIMRVVFTKDYPHWKIVVNCPSLAFCCHNAIYFLKPGPLEGSSIKIYGRFSGPVREAHRVVTLRLFAPKKFKQFQARFVPLLETDKIGTDVLLFDLNLRWLLTNFGPVEGRDWQAVVVELSFKLHTIGWVNSHQFVYGH
jgi:hypothetical protein